ncbi:MAG: hypothetical protein ABSD63_17090 [Candidatus Korobacteraceae bacterium]|jgi:hypothetical protein
MYHRFSTGSLVRNKKTNEDAKVLKTYVANNIAMYEVAVPRDSMGWELGTDRVAHWEDGDLEVSQNKFLSPK